LKSKHNYILYIANDGKTANNYTFLEHMRMAIHSFSVAHCHYYHLTRAAI